MPFGLTNAFMAFQQFMNDIFSDLLDVYVIIYLDDILIYSNNMSKHHWYVKEVLKYLCKTGFYTKAEKCEFHSESVEYLGYILFFFWPHHVQRQNKDYSRLARIQKSQGHSIFLRFHKLLLLVHLQLLRHASPRRIFLGSSTPLVEMLSTFSRKHLPPLLSLFIGFLMLNSLWKLIP